MNKLTLLILLLIVILFFWCCKVRETKYIITTDQELGSMRYYVDSFKIDNGCVSFYDSDWGNKTLCGTFQIHER